MDDTGSYKLTNTSADNYVFRSPRLRNVAITMPYFHSGKVWKLKDAVRVMGSAQLGISITDADADRIVAFLNTLTGTQPKVLHPILPPNSESTPRPVSN